MSDKNFCILPWVHFHFNQEGNARICCVADIPHKVGSVHTEKMLEIWNNDKMQEIRRKMLNDEKVDACKMCREMESIGKMSSRLVFNEIFARHIPIAKKQGVIASEKFRYWDLRFSNMCNFKCRMCGPLSSSQWVHDIQILNPKMAEQFKQIDVVKNSEHDIWAQLDPHFEHVERIYFAGGEPLLMKEHYQILERIIADGRADNVSLAYSTNFSELQFKGKHVFDLWQHFPDIVLMLSVDAPSPVGEYVRHGFDWNLFIQNVRSLQEKVPHVKLQVNPVFNILTAHTMTDLHRELVYDEVISPDNFYVTMLTFPLYLRADYMPPEMKQVVEKKMRDYAAMLKFNGAPTTLVERFGQMITFMNKGIHRIDQMDQFKEVMGNLDKIRNEKILEALPHLKSLWSDK